MPPLATNEEMESARERARLAMEGDKRKEKETKDNLEIEEKRKNARLAMEGSDRRLRREEREKTEKAKEEMRRKVDEEVKKRMAAAQAQKDALEKIKQEQEIAKKQELKQKEDRFVESKNIIEELKQERGSKIHPLRTLQTDLAGAVKTEQLSATKIAITEQEKKQLVPEKATPANGVGRKIIAFLILLIIFFALGGAGFWYAKNKNETVANPKITVQSFIYAENSTEINTTVKKTDELKTIMANLLATQGSTGETINNIYFTEEKIDTDGKTTIKNLIGFEKFLIYSQSAIPTDFARFVTAYMLGIYKGTENSSLFIALKIDLYENVFQELLDNEKGYFRQIFQSLDNKSLESVAGQNFSDYLYKNLKTRALKDETGKIVLIYSFLDRQTLVIAQNEDALYRAYVSYNTPNPN